MGISKVRFGKIYNKNKKKMLGQNASNEEIEDNYSYYVAIVDLVGTDGTLSFKLDHESSMTWEFEPVLT